MISQYTSKPTAVNYQIHAHLYQSLKEETVTVARPISTKIRQTISETTQNYADQSNGIGVVMDNFADVVGEIDKLQDRVDGIESLQEKMANILDVVSGHVGIGPDNGNPVLPGFSQMEIVNVIMEKVDSIETKLSTVPQHNQDSSNQTQLTNFEERLSLIEQKLGILSDNENDDIENRIIAVEKHLSKVTELEETVHSLNEKVTKLSVICQKLIHQLKGAQ
jgi:tetrahydromethanopterin S-methyltransferase subunit B